MYIGTLDYDLSCTDRSSVLRKYDPVLNHGHTHWRHCGGLKITLSSAPRPWCIVGRHDLECQCIPLVYKLLLLQTSEHQTARIQLASNLCNRHRVMENCKLLASALSETLIPPFCSVEVCKLASLVIPHSLVNRPAGLLERIVPLCCAGSAKWSVSRPNRARRPGHSTLYEDDRRCLGYKRNLMRAHLVPMPPNSFAVSLERRKWCVSILHARIFFILHQNQRNKSSQWGLQEKR